MTLAILNYGLANLRSVQKAFEQVGHPAEVITTPEQIAAADRLVLPGVGAVADAIDHIRGRGLEQPILDHINRGRPFLGVCLGLQMLMGHCTEGGEHRGLGVIDGDCVRLDVDQTAGLKVPHMGWNALDLDRRDAPLFAGLPADGEASVYFVHGYHVRPTDRSWVAAHVDYGGPVVAAVWRDNVMATQFHPEKSQAVGLRMLGNFARL